MQIPSNFTVSPISQKGDVYGTEFTFTSNLPAEYTAFAWSFGDNTMLYQQSSAAHIYNYPGIYTVTLSAWTDYGTLYTDTADINVDYVFRDRILFSHIPSTFGTPGLPSKEPFTVALTSAKIDHPISIVLQSLNTRSVPHYAIPEKWRFLTPKWRFLDATTNEVLEGPLVLSSVPIYNEEGRAIAVRAESTFYYVDDLSTGLDPNKDCPLLLVATLSTEGFSYPPESLIYPYASYSNSEVARASIAWQINDIVPTKLKVSDNFLNEVFPIKWSNVPIPVMITCVSDTSVLDSFSGVDGFSTNALSYPRTNELGGAFPVVLTLSSNTMEIPSSYYTVDEAPLYFKAKDEYDNVASGYVFTTITPLSPIDGTVVVAVSTIATNQVGVIDAFAFPVGYPIFPDVYISNPEKSTINRINLVTYPTNCHDINHYKSLGILTEGSITVVTVPTLTSTDLVNYTLSGTAAVYGMAFSPLKNRLYTCDADQNLLSMYDGGTTLLSTVQISSIFGSENLAPSHVSIDRNCNVWVSLFDDHRIAKFDADLNYLLSAAPLFHSHIALDDPQPGFVEQEDGFYLDLDVINSDTYNAPPVVETDSNNNVWVCYPDPTNSLLVKFDTNGNELLRAALPGDSVPVSLSIDARNGVWVACKRTDKIMNFSTNGTLVASVSGFLKPSYTAMDRSNNVWVAHGYNFCSVYNTTTSEISTWKVSTLAQTIDRVYEYTQKDIDTAYSQDELWGGLATDVYNRVWVIDSLNNIAMLFNPEDPTQHRAFEIVPHTDTQYVILVGDNFVTNIPVDSTKSAQAGGDWTGNRWYQKYSGTYNSLPIYGESAPFMVYDLDKSYQIAKVNEDFNYSEYFKTLALPDTINNNPLLFNEFLPALVGDGNPANESIGRIIFEKTANFTGNHGDYETADIDNLLSIAQEMDVETKSFGSNFPVAVNRLLSLLSVPKQRLRGVPKLDPDLVNNVGPMVTETSLITANEYYLMRDKFYDTQQLVYINPLSSGEVEYPLSKIQIEGLRQPVIENYYFFTYSDSISGEYTGNLIKWDSPYTTISYTLSTNEEWYGDGGLIETMFNNLLTKQLYLQ